MWFSNLWDHMRFLNKANTMPSYAALPAAKQQPLLQREKGPAKYPPCGEETNKMTMELSIQCVLKSCFSPSLPQHAGASPKSTKRSPAACDAVGTPLRLMLPHHHSWPRSILPVHCNVTSGPSPSQPPRGAAGRLRLLLTKNTVIESQHFFVRHEESSLHMFRIINEKDHCLGIGTLLIHV